MKGDETEGVDTPSELVICPSGVLGTRFGLGDEDFGEG
jgi:hypothetical protein